MVGDGGARERIFMRLLRFPSDFGFQPLDLSKRSAGKELDGALPYASGWKNMLVKSWGFLLALSSFRNLKGQRRWV